MVETRAGNLFDILEIPFPSFNLFRFTVENPFAPQGLRAGRERKALRDRTYGAVVFAPFGDGKIAPPQPGGAAKSGKSA